MIASTTSPQAIREDRTDIPWWAGNARLTDLSSDSSYLGDFINFVATSNKLNFK